MTKASALGLISVEDGAEGAFGPAGVNTILAQGATMNFAMDLRAKFPW